MHVFYTTGVDVKLDSGWPVAAPVGAEAAAVTVGAETGAAVTAAVAASRRWRRSSTKPTRLYSHDNHMTLVSGTLERNPTSNLNAAAAGRTKAIQMVWLVVQITGTGRCTSL